MDVFQHLDPYLVLQSYYQERKKAEPDFSYSLWSEELGLKSSSTLRMMVNRKKRLSFGLTEKFAQRYLYSLDEQNYFRLLATYAHASGPHERAAAWNSLSQILAKRLPHQEVRDYLNFVSDLLTPKLLTMLSFDDQSWTEANLMKALSETPERLRESLGKLESMGLAKAFDNGSERSWQATQKLVKVRDLPGDIAMKAYHNASLDEAKEAQGLPVDSRKYKSLLVPLSSDELSDLHEEVNAFVNRLVAKYRSDCYKDRRLFKLNLNYFPISQAIEQTDQTAIDTEPPRPVTK